MLLVSAVSRPLDVPHHVAQFVAAHHVGIGEWVQLTTMLAGRDAVPITVLVPLTIPIHKERPVLSVRVDDVRIAHPLCERVVARERHTILDLRASGEVSDLHDVTPVYVTELLLNLLFVRLFSPARPLHINVYTSLSFSRAEGFL